MQLKPNHPTAEPASLLRDTALLVDRLLEVRNRLRAIHDTVHGPAPHEVAASNQPPEPVPSIARNVSKAHAVIDNIYESLTDFEKMN